MKNLFKIAVASAGVLAFQIQSVFAQCTLNGEEVPCEVLEQQVGNILGASLAIFAVAFVVGIVAFIFWLMMIIHAATKPIENKALWIVVMILTGIVGAIIYYFVVKRTFKEAVTENPMMPNPGDDGAGTPPPAA